MGSQDAKAYLASPEVVAASASSGKVSGPGSYEKPVGVEKVMLGEGNGFPEEDTAISVEEALDRLIAQADLIIESAEQNVLRTSSATNEADDEGLTAILPGFLEKVEGEIIFCDSDNIYTDRIYRGKYTYQDNVPVEKMAEECLKNYDPSFGCISREGDILVSGFFQLWT
jgi:homoaconitate hydratase